MKDLTRYSSLTRMGTVSWAVGATISPGNQGSLPFFLSPLTSTHTILPISGSRSTSLLWALLSCLVVDSDPSSPSSSLLSSCRLLPPLLPPKTGVPKCSGWVRGSWSSVSLSAKCLPLFKQSAVLLSVVISPSSKTVSKWKTWAYFQWKVVKGNLPTVYWLQSCILLMSPSQ